MQIDSYVVCRVIRKEHFGPSTECIYAPFSEQDWDDGINEKIQQVLDQINLCLVHLSSYVNVKCCVGKPHAGKEAH